MSASDKNVCGKQEENSILCKNYGPVEWLDWKLCLYEDDLAIFRFFYAENSSNQPNWDPLLHPDEIKRAWRYHRRDDHLRSLYTRSLLRIVAGKYTNQNPSEIRLTTGLKNKPELPDNPEWHINATHSGDWILLAMSKSSVGIDVEEVKPNFAFAEVIATAFSAQERQFIENDKNGLSRFYELWTKKESFVKATGSGIDETFAQIPALSGFHSWEPPQSEATGAWIIDGFYVEEGYPAAVAYGNSTERLRFYTLDHGIFTSPNV